MARVLYISYDGVLEPLGESQALQYLEGLAGEHSITLLSFEKAADWVDVERRRAMQQRVRDRGIEWHPLRYHRRPTLPATAYDIARGIGVGAWVARRNRVQVVHARGYVPVLMALELKRLLDVRVVFDMRAFWADERVDNGTWRRESAVYRAVKRLERRGLLESDIVISLTHAGAEAIRGFDYLRGRDVRLEVIPTCANLEAFHPPASNPPVERTGFRLGYVGNIAGWYDFGPVLAALDSIRNADADARLAVLNQGQHSLIARALQKWPHLSEAVDVRSARFAEVPAAMREMDATAFFIRPVFSKLASAPTKLGEFLGCGVPCMVNAGVGDMSRLVESERVGVVVGSLDADEVAGGARRLMEMAQNPEVRARCVRVAHRHFALARGVEAYGRIYGMLGERPAGLRMGPPQPLTFSEPVDPAAGLRERQPTEKEWA
jgi:hypothetical protein